MSSSRNTAAKPRPGIESADPLPWSDAHEDLVIGNRFDEVVAARAGMAALCQDDRSWTYGQLADGAEQVAGYLLRIKPTGRVAIYLGNSFQHFASIFGAWKAGWVTIPMDPRYPSARNEQILKDADPDLILTDQEHRNNLSPSTGLPIEDRAIDQYEHGPKEALRSISQTIGPETPATILYTSGSTGEPKGVLHTHASLMHMTKRRSRLMRARPDDALTLLYSASVMGGLSSVLSSFLNGASLHPRDIKNEGIADMGPWLRRHRITCCHSVTSLYRAFTHHIGSGQSFPHLRLIILGGEQAYPADIELGRDIYGPSVIFYCGIGSTEINTARQILVPPGTDLPTGRMPFGFPVEGVEAIILDPKQKPVPSGETGEIAFRSRYLSSGYWRRPEMTKKRFIPDPEGGDLTTYLTGDLGRIDETACLTGAGRNDHQVKIRGFRVEPGEVNAHLMAQPGIGEACTTAVKSRSGTLSLAAFFVTAPNAEIDIPTLRQVLAAELPDFMVPDHLIALDAFPRTPNGKIDQAQLRLPGQGSVPADSRPKTTTERRLATLWSSVLELDSVPADAGFFDLGGTSLAAITLLARIEKKMHRQLPVSSLLEHPTVRDLAAWLDRDEPRTGYSGLVPIRSKGVGHPVYLVGGMTGEVFFSRRLLDHLQSKRPVYALEPDTLSGKRTEHSRIEDIASYYAQVIRAHQPEGALLLAGYSFGGTVVYELARQLRAAGRDIAQTIIFDSAPPRPHPANRPLNPTHQSQSSPPTRQPTRRKKPSPFRFFTLKWWTRGGGEWRRMVWRLKYVRFYELLTRLHLSPPISWRRCYAYWATHYMSESYRAKSYDGPITLFRSEARREQGDKGWRDLCGNSLKMIRIPGDHGSIFREPDIQHLARELDQIL